MEHVDANFGPAHALFSQGNRSGFKMGAGRVDIRRVAESKLEIDRRADADDFTDFVMPNKAADIVWNFDVDVEGHRRGGADRRKLRKAEIGGRVERRQS